MSLVYTRELMLSIIPFVVEMESIQIRCFSTKQLQTEALPREALLKAS